MKNVIEIYEKYYDANDLGLADIKDLYNELRDVSLSMGRVYQSFLNTSQVPDSFSLEEKNEIMQLFALLAYITNLHDDFVINDHDFSISEFHVSIMTLTGMMTTIKFNETFNNNEFKILKKTEDLIKSFPVFHINLYSSYIDRMIKDENEFDLNLYYSKPKEGISLHSVPNAIKITDYPTIISSIEFLLIKAFNDGLDMIETIRVDGFFSYTNAYFKLNGEMIPFGEPEGVFSGTAEDFDDYI